MEITEFRPSTHGSSIESRSEAIFRFIDQSKHFDFDFDFDLTFDSDFLTLTFCTHLTFDFYATATSPC